MVPRGRGDWVSWRRISGALPKGQWWGGKEVGRQGSARSRALSSTLDSRRAMAPHCSAPCRALQVIRPSTTSTPQRYAPALRADCLFASRGNPRMTWPANQSALLRNGSAPAEPSPPLGPGGGGGMKRQGSPETGCHKQDSALSRQGGLQDGGFPPRPNMGKCRSSGHYPGDRGGGRFKRQSWGVGCGALHCGSASFPRFPKNRRRRPACDLALKAKLGVGDCPTHRPRPAAELTATHHQTSG